VREGGGKASFLLPGKRETGGGKRRGKRGHFLSLSRDLLRGCRGKAKEGNTFLCREVSSWKRDGGKGGEKGGRGGGRRGKKEDGTILFYAR